MKKAIVFYKLGGHKIVDVPEDLHNDWIYRQINVDWMEIVRPRKLPAGFVMIVDEEGRLKPNVRNSAGCFLYDTPAHGQPIMGDILILKEVDGFDGFELDGMSDEEVSKILSLVMEKVIMA